VPSFFWPNRAISNSAVQIREQQTQQQHLAERLNDFI